MGDTIRRARLARRAWPILLLIGVAIGVGISRAAAESYIPLHHDAIVHQPRPVDSTELTFRSRPSQRNLLHLQREAPYKLPLSASVSSTPRTLKVLGIRVQFPLENPDDPATTGTGHFDLRDTTTFFDSTGHHFDSAPHDRTYFEAHLRSLGLYWNTVSNGLISLQSTIFPREPDSAYNVQDSMSYYGRERAGDSGVAFGLRQFVIDAAKSASQSEPSLRFSDYDAVFIFHPGSDRQSDILGDSPRDLFTGFLRLDSTLHLRGGSDSIAEAIIMPETETQDGRISVLNGVMAHEFGHTLGLVDLYNTRNFMTQVGNFSLYDNNAADVGVSVDVAGQERTVFGALPVFPDAWSRAYLGFVSVTDVTDSTRVPVPAAELFGPLYDYSQVLRVPISATEYYLIENRRTDVDGQGDPALRWDSLAYVVRGPIDTLTRRDNREYDFLLPDSKANNVPGGLLIWHVDEGVAALDYVTNDDIPDNFLANTLQWDPNRRFVSLFEADGIVDFGGFYSSGTGDFRDYFFSPNNRELSATTNPPAISNTGGATGIHIFNISAPSVTMTFDVTVTGRLVGFPVYAGREDGMAGAPIVSDLTEYPGDGRPAIFVGHGNSILAWKWDGTPIGSVEAVDTVLAFDTTKVVRKYRVVATGLPSDSGWIAPPFIGDFNGEEGVADLVVVSRTGHVHEWRMADANHDGLFDPVLEKTTTARPAAPPVIWKGATTTNFKGLIVSVEGGQLDVFDLVTGRDTSYSFPATVRGVAGTSILDGVAIWRSDPDHWVIGSVADPSQYATLGADSLLPPILGDLDHDSVLDAVVEDVAGRIWCVETSHFLPLAGFPLSVGVAPSASPVLADLDRDGFLDIVATGGGRLYAYSRTGALLPNFPAVIGRVNAPDSTSASPVVTDFGTAGLLSVLIGGETRAVYGFNGNASPVDGFPHPLGGLLTTPAATAMNSQDHLAAVFARASDGYLYAFEAPLAATPSKAIWPMAYHDSCHTSTVTLKELEPEKTYTEFFMPERAYVYPNPAQNLAIVRYWLGSAAEVHIKIFDLAGNLVKEADGPGIGGAYNEWSWGCAGAASGVYFAHLEVRATADGHRETALCKMSVVQ